MIHFTTRHSTTLAASVQALELSDRELQRVAGGVTPTPAPTHPAHPTRPVHPKRPARPANPAHHAVLASLHTEHTIH